MTRRKSRPLISTEIFFSSQEQSETANSPRSCTYGSSQHQLLSSQSSIFNSQSTVGGLPMILPVKAPSATASTSNVHGRAAQLSTKDAPQGSCLSGTSATQINQRSASWVENVHTSIPDPADYIKSISGTAPSKRRSGYLANRRSAPFILPDDHCNPTQQQKEEAGQTSTVNGGTKSSQSVERKSSQVRLSLSLDGKAEVTTSTGMTPSPPRSQPVPSSNSAPRINIGLQRSFSDIEPLKKSAEGALQMPYSRRPMAGRSRDARTWEFYCDSDARNALTEQAEREEKGSATAAIGLIRSRSHNNKVMTPNANKRNAHTPNPVSTKRLKGDGSKTGKPKLVRTTSSFARLQTINGNSVKQRPAKVGGKDPKSSSQPAIYQEYEGDSDKENWEPGTRRSNPQRRRPAGLQHVNRILEESLHVPSQSSSLDALMNRQSSAKSSRNEKWTSSSEGDEEVAAFTGENVPHEEEELDCVQNLLSLSQAAWQ